MKRRITNILSIIVSDSNWRLSFALGLVYVPLFLLISQCDYSLVNDFRPFHMDFSGRWPKEIMDRMINPSAMEYWLYRPVPEMLEWFFAGVFRGSPGVWHLLTLGMRIVTISLVWKLLVAFNLSRKSVIFATLFVAFFPAIPEVWLTYAEIWTMPLLLASYLGLVKLYTFRDKLCENRALILKTTIAFVLLSMCKEVLAPLSFVFLIGYFFVLWKNGKLLGRAALVVMGVALIVQAHHCIMTLHAPYGASRISMIERVGGNSIWIIKNLFLFNTNILPVSLILIAIFIAGFGYLVWQCRERREIAAIALGGLMVCVAVNSIVPFRALRYLYPCGIMMAVVLGFGIDFLIVWLPKTRCGHYVLTFVIAAIYVFNTPVLLAQAFVMWNTSRTDWLFLNHVVVEFSKGRDVVLIKSANYERSYWIKGELEGVNMTGQLGVRGVGRYIEIEKVEDVVNTKPNSLIILANAFEAQDSGGLKNSLLAEEKRFDLRNDGIIFPLLGKWRAIVLKLNPCFEYVSDAGSSRFPGHYWITYKHVQD